MVLNGLKLAETLVQSVKGSVSVSATEVHTEPHPATTTESFT